MTANSETGHGLWLQAGSVLNYGEKLGAGKILRRTDLVTT